MRTRGCRYGIPATAASDFEEAFKREKPDLFAHQPDVLFHLVTMLSPRILQQHGVPVHTCIQGAGEFVITFPNAYHGGFNHGVNAAEAVNFVPADWMRFGAASMLRYRAFRKPSVLCYEQLLLDVVAEGSSVTKFWAAKELGRAVAEECQLRYNLYAAVRASFVSFLHDLLIPRVAERCRDACVCAARSAGVCGRPEAGALGAALVAPA